MAFQALNNVEVLSQFLPIVTSSTTSSSTSGLVPGSRWTYVDQTSLVATATVSSSAGDFLFPRKTFRAYVFVKAPVTGTTWGPVIQLEAATSTAFSTGNSTGSGTQTINGIYVLDSKIMGGTSTTSVYSYTLTGTVPIVAGCQFARVNFVLGVFGSGGMASSTAVDIVIDGS